MFPFSVQLLKKLSSHTQKGFAHLVLILVLLVVGIGTGTLLLQNRTNFSPQARVDPTTSNQIKRDPLLGVRISDPLRVDQAVKLGVAKFRVSVESADAFYNETTEQKAFLTPLTQLFSAAKLNNIQLVIVIKPGAPVETADLENRIGKLATQLGSYNNVVFELGNEPNGKNPEGNNFWNGDYNSFAKFIKDATVAVRKHWPSAPIIIGALDMQGKINSTNDEAARADFNAFLDALSGQTNLAFYDYAIHAYHDPNWFNRIYAIQREELNKRNINAKLWLTETGVTSGDNPQNLISIIEAAEQKSDIKAVIIHALDSTDDFRLLDGSSPRAPYTKVQEFVNNNPKSITVTVQTKGSGSTPTGTVNASDKPSFSTNKSCGNNPVSPPSSETVWHAFCSDKDYAPGHFTCNTNADCPQNTVQTGSGINAATSNQCVQFKEGSRCIQLRLTAGYNANDPAFDTPNDTWVNNPENIPFGRVGLGENEGTGKAPRADFTYFIRSWEKTIARIREDQRVKQLLAEAEVKKQEELLAQAEQAAKEAKEANEAWLKDKGNAELAKKASDAAKKAADAVAAAEAIRKLAKLEQMLKGETTEQCVKADLGIRPWLTAPRLKSRGEDTREDGSPGEKVNRHLRLYVCSGKDSKLKWRVATEGNDNTQGENNEQSSATHENSMERILGLHAESESSPNFPTPRYPFDKVKGGITTLYGQDEAGVRKSLEVYINAAKMGKAVLE